ncbi:MAG: YHYH domain-containing protein [Beijerinckiaceae bacterium]
MFTRRGLLAGLMASLFISAVEAHPGALGRDGCHRDRKRGGRHCHGGAAKPGQRRRFQGFGGNTRKFSSRHRRRRVRRRGRR